MTYLKPSKCTHASDGGVQVRPLVIGRREGSPGLTLPPGGRAGWVPCRCCSAKRAAAPKRSRLLGHFRSERTCDARSASRTRGPHNDALVPSPRSSAFDPARRPQRLADAAHAAALPVGLSGPCAVRARMSARGQARHRQRSDPAEKHRRLAVAGDAGDCRRAGRTGCPGRGLRPAAAVDVVLHRVARVLLRQRDAGGDAHAGAEDLPPSALAVAALPPGAAHWRRDPRDRPRHPRHLVADQLHALFDPADADRDHAGRRLPGLALRSLVRRDRRRELDDLHRLHGQRDQLAHGLPSPLERARVPRHSRARSTRCSISRRSSTSATRTTRHVATTRRWRPASARP